MLDRCVCCALAVFLLTTGLAGTAVADVRFAVLADPHYYDSDLGTTGEAFEAYLQQDRKLIRESEALMKAAVEAIITEHAAQPLDFVMIPGDLTKDGELTSHQEMAGYLGQLEGQNIPVYVVPGNHDINNPQAYSYNGAAVTPVANVSPSDFKDIYSAYGYGQAVQQDPNSLSYTAEPVPGVVLLGLDSCKYDNNDAQAHAETGGSLPLDTRSWAVDRITEAEANGKQVIAFLHHGLLEHYSGQKQVFPEYVIDDEESVSLELAKAGLRMAFTGHYHANDVTRQKWGASGNMVYDVETGSLVTFPCPWRVVTLKDDRTVDIETRYITEIDYDTGGLPLSIYASTYLYEGLYGIAMYTLMQPVESGGYGLDQETAQEFAPHFAEAFMAHYAGDESPTPETLGMLSGYISDPNPVVSQLGMWLYALWTDLEPADGDLSFKFDALTGDMNGDCCVNMADYQLFRDNYGQVGPNDADLDVDGAVNMIDYQLFRIHYGAVCP